MQQIYDWLELEGKLLDLMKSSRTHLSGVVRDGSYAVAGTGLDTLSGTYLRPPGYEPDELKQILACTQSDTLMTFKPRTNGGRSHWI